MRIIEGCIVLTICGLKPETSECAQWKSCRCIKKSKCGVYRSDCGEALKGDELVKAPAGAFIEPLAQHIFQFFWGIRRHATVQHGMTVWTHGDQVIDGNKAVVFFYCRLGYLVMNMDKPFGNLAVDL